MATNDSINNTLAITTTFNSSGTFYKNNKSKFMHIYLFGAGTSGASGRRGSSGGAGGGGGGGGGQSLYFFCPASAFGTSESVTISAGGIGGSAQTSDNANGNAGSPGGNCSIGNLSTFNNNLAPLGGTNGSASGGSTSSLSKLFFLNASNSNGSSGANGTITAGANASTATMTNFNGTGGGGGGGANSTTERAGGNSAGRFGVNGSTIIIAGASGGTESGTINGANGSPSPTSGAFYCAGTGGGGGGGQKSGAVAGNGGNGGFPGGGGGGGGGSLNGTNSGAGGNGGDGQIIVIEIL